MGRKRAMVWSCSEKGNQSLLLYHQKRYRVDRSYSSYTTLAMLPDYRLPWIIPDFYGIRTYGQKLPLLKKSWATSDVGSRTNPQIKTGEMILHILENLS